MLEPKTMVSPPVNEWAVCFCAVSSGLVVSTLPDVGQPGTCSSKVTM